jgi:hypothetical protein
LQDKSRDDERKANFRRNEKEEAGQESGMKERWLTMSPVSSVTEEKKARNESMHTSSESPPHRHLAQYQIGLPTVIVAGSLAPGTCHKYQAAFWEFFMSLSSPHCFTECF